MKTNSSIDFAKYIAAILVVAAHTFITHPSENISHILFTGGICRLIVPFFFCCTGFLLAENIQNTNAIYKYIRKQLKFYLLCSAFYLPIQLVQNLVASEM